MRPVSSTPRSHEPFARVLVSNERLEERVADRTRAGRRLRLLWEAARILLTSDDEEPNLHTYELKYKDQILNSPQTRDRFWI